MADDRVCLYITVTMEIKQKINMQLEKISRIAQHTAKTIIRIEDVKYKLMKQNKLQDKEGKPKKLKLAG